MELLIVTVHFITDGLFIDKKEQVSLCVFFSFYGSQHLLLLLCKGQT